jgi:quercetin dioxygenase-like cupin family protein
MKRCALLLFTSLLLSQTPSEVEITAEPHHHQILTNDQVRVFNVEVDPASETLMHWHRHDYIYVTLGAADISNQMPNKPPAEVKLQDGQTGFSAAPFAHIVRELSKEAFRNVTIELRQDEKLRPSPSHWDQDRGLNVLPGGSKEILFVKDNVRVSEVELQSGGVIPNHHHAGPHLAVALTDYELHSDAPGKPSETIRMTRGESRWFPGNYSHSVTNAGHTSAKFITLEFP